MKSLFRIIGLMTTMTVIIVMIMLVRSHDGLNFVFEQVESVKQEIKMKELEIRTEQLRKHDKYDGRSLGNFYQEGQCTFYVFEERRHINKDISSSWGDAKHWAKRAKDDGYLVNHTPSEGSILQTSHGKLGHVGIVKEMRQDGSIIVSDMNYEKSYEVTERLITVDSLHHYQFIHEKI